MRQLGPAALHPSQQALLVSLHPGKTWIGSNTEKMTVTEILLSDEGKLHFDLYVSIYIYIYIYLYVCYPEKKWLWPISICHRLQFLQIFRSSHRPTDSLPHSWPPLLHRQHFRENAWSACPSIRCQWPCTKVRAWTKSAPLYLPFQDRLLQHRCSEYHNKVFLLRRRMGFHLHAQAGRDGRSSHESLPLFPVLSAIPKSSQSLHTQFPKHCNIQSKSKLVHTILYVHISVIIRTYYIYIYIYIHVSYISVYVTITYHRTM